MASSGSTPSTAQKRADTRRVVGLLTPGIAGPVASLWASHLHRGGSGRLSEAGAASQQGPISRTTTFVVTRTEDAMDSVLPCVAEEFFRPMMQNRFGNAAKLQFRYSHH